MQLLFHKWYKPIYLIADAYICLTPSYKVSTILINTHTMPNTEIHKIFYETCVCSVWLVKYLFSLTSIFHDCLKQIHMYFYIHTDLINKGVYS